MVEAIGDSHLTNEDKNHLISRLHERRTASIPFSYTVRGAKKGKYVYFHLGDEIIRVKEFLVREDRLLRNDFSRGFTDVNDRVPSNHAAYSDERLLPYLYHTKVIESYKLWYFPYTLRDSLLPIPRRANRAHGNQTNIYDTPSDQPHNMVSTENVINTLAKNSKNVICAGIIKRLGQGFVGIPIQYENSIKIFVKKEASASKKASRRRGEEITFKTKSKSLQPPKKLKWIVLDIEDVTVTDIDVLHKTRVTESGIIKNINSVGSCFNLQFTITSLDGEIANENEVQNHLKQKLFEEKGLHNLKGVLVSRNEKEGETKFIVNYGGIPITFLAKNCTIYSPSLKGFNMPKNKSKVEGSIAKIIRNKRTIFKMDEKVKILKIDKNSKTPQRHYFTVASLETPSKVSVVYSHNLKVL